MWVSEEAFERLTGSAVWVKKRGRGFGEEHRQKLRRVVMQHQYQYQCMSEQ